MGKHEMQGVVRWTEGGEIERRRCTERLDTVYLLVLVDGERRDVHRRGGLHSDQSSLAAELRHEVGRDLLIRGARGDRPPRHLLALYVLLVQIRSDPAPQSRLLLRHAAHRLEQQPQVILKLCNRRMVFTQRLRSARQVGLDCSLGGGATLPY